MNTASVKANILPFLFLLHTLISVYISNKYKLFLNTTSIPLSHQIKLIISYYHLIPSPGSVFPKMSLFFFQIRIQIMFTCGTLKFLLIYSSPIPSFFVEKIGHLSCKTPPISDLAYCLLVFQPISPSPIFLVNWLHIEALLDSGSVFSGKNTSEVVLCSPYCITIKSQPAF